MSLILAANQIETLREHCRNCWPEEACALLVGSRRDLDDIIVEEVILSDNIAEDRQRYFEIDPAVRIRLERELRGAPNEIVGVFHSHPGGPAQPSKTDAGQVIEKQFIWLIAASSQQGIEDINAFKPIENAGFSPYPFVALEKK